MITIGHWSLWLLCPKNSSWNHSAMTKHVDLLKSLCCACASHRWCFVGWIWLKSYLLSNKTLEIVGIMKEKPAIEYWKYVVNHFYDWFYYFAFRQGWSLICTIKLQRMVYQTSVLLIPLLIRKFCQRKKS